MHDGLPPIREPDLRCHAREARCVPVGSTDAAAPDVTSVRERLEPSARAARACPGLPAGGATIELTFRPDGRVATVDGSAAGPARGCVERAFRQAMIDAHAPRPGGPLTIRYPVRPR